MSYFDKYLKYKKKYIDLKNMLGGKEEKEFSWSYLDNLWENGNENDRVKYSKGKVSLPPYNHYFSEYCWIGPPRNTFNRNYGLGFFLYKINKAFMIPYIEERFNEKFKIFEYDGKKKRLDFDKIPDYAIWRITRDNIGPIIPLPEGLDLPAEITPLKTPIDLEEDSNVIIKKGSSYGWYHRNINDKNDNDCWIFKDGKNYYFANLIDI